MFRIQVIVYYLLLFVCIIFCCIKLGGSIYLYICKACSYTNKSRNNLLVNGLEVDSVNYSGIWTIQFLSCSLYCIFTFLNFFGDFCFFFIKRPEFFSCFIPVLQLYCSLIGQLSLSFLRMNTLSEIPWDQMQMLWNIWQRLLMRPFFELFSLILQT